jgi:hypothetical protein
MDGRPSAGDGGAGHQPGSSITVHGITVGEPLTGTPELVEERDARER